MEDAVGLQRHRLQPHRTAVAEGHQRHLGLALELAADGDPRTPKDTTLGDGLRCDEAGCIGRLRDGSPVAIAKTIEAFEEDCRRAALVVSARDVPRGCAAFVVDRQVWRRSGAIALRRVGEGFEVTPTRRAGYDRPWARAIVPGGDTSEPGSLRPAGPQPRDATPRAEDLEAGD